DPRRARARQARAHRAAPGGERHGPGHDPPGAAAHGVERRDRRRAEPSRRFAVGRRRRAPSVVTSGAGVKRRSMALNAEVLDALFDIAVADASPGHEAILVPLGTRPAAWDSAQEAKLVLPSQGPFTWQDAVEPQSRSLANGHQDAHRVVVLCGDGVTEPTALALMRWCLEIARQWERHPPLHEFGLFLADRKSV